MVHVVPLKSQNRNAYGATPPVADAVHVTGVPAVTGKVTLDVRAVTVKAGARCQSIARMPGSQLQPTICPASLIPCASGTIFMGPLDSAGSSTIPLPVVHRTG